MEKGIIGQEIMMYDDYPDWRVYLNAMQAMYHNNPIKIDITGTIETIGKINKEILYKCYKTFYNPSNMVLVISGDFEPEKIIGEVKKRLIEKRIETLKQTKRIELGEWVIEKIIKEFCDSAYISQENFVRTLYELIDIFYYYKNETNDMISDDELIKFMRKYYDELANGDLEYLAGTIMEKMKNNILNNKPIDYEIGKYESEETDES